MRKIVKIDTGDFSIYLENKRDRGVTLIALIITIIVLVILAAVSISVAYKSKVVDYATESAQDYVQESLVENKIMEGTTKLLDSTVNRISDIMRRNRRKARSINTSRAKARRTRTTRDNRSDKRRISKRRNDRKICRL